MKRIVICLFTLALLITLSSALALPALAAVDDHTHSYKLAAVRKEPTCTASGTGLYRCEVCGHQEMRDIPALGHKWSAWKTTKAATCAKAGTQTRTCSRCGEKQTKSIAATGHTYEWKVTRKATCGADGTRQQVCKVCGAKGKTETIPATGKHTWTKWTITKAPTCKAAGEQSRSCSVCGEKQTKVAPKTDEHTFGAWTVTQAASCEQAGEEKRACGLCGKEESRAIDALGHDWDKGVTTVPAGYLETGVKTYTCARCGATKTEEVPVNAPMSGGSIMDQLRNIPPDAGSHDELRIVTQPVGGAIDHEGGSLTLTVEAAGGTPPYTYQWRGMSSVTDWPFWFNVENGTDSTLEAQKGNRRYYCQVYDSKGNHVDSEKVQVGYNLYISQQPKNTNSRLSDTVFIEAAGGTPPYSYAWYIALEDGTGHQFSNQVNHSIPSNIGIGQVYCVVSDDAGASVTSNTVTIYDVEPLWLNSTSTPVIVPANADISSLSEDLQVSFGGGMPPYKIRWWFDANPLTDDKSTEENSSSVIASDLGIYTFRVMDAVGERKYISISVDYEQLDYPINTSDNNPIIIRQPESVKLEYREDGQYSVTFACEAISPSTGDDSNLDYIWEIFDKNYGWRYAGLTYKMLPFSLVQPGTKCRCKVTDRTTGEYVYSDIATVMVALDCYYTERVESHYISGNTMHTDYYYRFYFSGGTAPYTLELFRLQITYQEGSNGMERKYKGILVETSTTNDEKDLRFERRLPNTYTYIDYSGGEPYEAYAAATYYVKVTDATGQTCTSDWQ